MGLATIAVAALVAIAVEGWVLSTKPDPKTCVVVPTTGYTSNWGLKAADKRC